MTDVRHVVSGDSNYGIGFHEAEYNRPRDWGVAGKISSFWRGDGLARAARSQPEDLGFELPYR